MKKKLKRKPVAIPYKVETVAVAKRGQIITQRIALGFVCIIGLLVLYFCLLPALAQNTDETMYVYFDNSLSQYDEVLYSVNGGEFKQMTKLSNSGNQPSSLDNVNKDNVYVTAEAITGNDTIVFKGVDDGTVYDTVVNYRVNSASREWGYDYFDFTWTSPAISGTDIYQNNCYYAPPKLMQYTYGDDYASLVDTNGTTLEPGATQFIYSHGDSKDGNGAKPENTSSFVQPNTAWNRTFKNAGFTMNGMLGSVNEINPLSVTSQSIKNGTTYEGSFANGDGSNGLERVENTFKATATFFDYFSDWELAGKPLVDHINAYSFTAADAADPDLFTMNKDLEPETSSALVYRDFEDGATNGFVPWVYKQNNGITSESAAYHNGSKSLKVDNGSGADNGVAYPFTGELFDASNNYSVSIWVRPTTTSDSTYNLRAYYLKTDPSSLTGSTLNPYSSSDPDAYDNAWLDTNVIASTNQWLVDSETSTGGNWVELTAEISDIPADAKGIIFVVDGGVAGSNDEDMYIDDFSIVAYKETVVFEETFNGVSITSSETNNGDGTTTYISTAGKFVLEYIVADGDTTSSVVSRDDYEATDNLRIMIKNAQEHFYLPLDGIVNNGQTYELSFQGASYSSSGAVPTLYLEYVNSSGEVSKEMLGSYSLVHEKWNTFTAEFTYTEVEGCAPRLCFELEDNRNYCIDDFKITTLEEAEKETPAKVLSKTFNDHQKDSTGTAYLYSDKESYALTGTVTSANGGVLNVTITYPANGSIAEETVELGSFHLNAGEETEISIDDIQHPFGHTGATINVQMADGSDFAANLTYKRTYINSVSETIYSNDFEENYNGLVPYVVTGKVNTGIVVRNPSNYNSSALDGNAILVNRGNSGSKAVYTLTADALSADDVFTVSAMATPVDATTLTLGVQYFDANGTAITQEVPGAGSDGQILTTIENVVVATWYELKGRYSFPENAAYAEIYFLANGNTDFYLDNLSIEKVSTKDFASGSFSNGTERISYSYQGMLWNQAISEYYLTNGYSSSINFDGNIGNDIIPLYFGSNSWFTGNGRYEQYDRNSKALFTVAEIVNAVNAFTYNPATAYQKYWNMGTDSPFIKSANIHDDRGNLPDPPVGAYLVPYERQYLRTLFGFNQTGAKDSTGMYAYSSAMNIPMGHSNSRGVAGLVKYENGKIILNNTTVEVPYFNADFINGQNSMNAKLGEVYNNVAFDFVFNETTGYYEYDSTRAKYATRVSYDVNTDSYYMDYYNYDEIVFGNQTNVVGVKKADASLDDENGSSQTVYQFYPFNSPATNDLFATENLMFGMKLDIPFNMYANKEDRTNSMFKFSGDDDVWVYVDDTQVLDIGGTHTAVGGLVDLKNGYAVTGSSYLDTTGVYENGTLKSGTSTGVTDVEKAAFAILASAKVIRTDEDGDVIRDEDGNPVLVEVGIDPTKSGGNFIEIETYALDAVRTGVSANFFDDVYEANNADSPVTYKYTIDANNETITVEFTNVAKYGGSAVGDNGSGKATFSLKTFKLAGEDDNTNGGDLDEHMLSIYYMERGLNSSNFKLEFNFVENTTRTVEKVWGDDMDYTGENENVAVELYRTEPVESETPQDFIMPDGKMIIRVTADRTSETTLEWTTGENTGFVSTNQQDVTVQFRPANENETASVMTLFVNGEPLSLAYYRELKSTIDMKILVGGVEITEDRFIGATADAKDADKIYLNLSDNNGERSIIRIVFTARSYSKTSTQTVDIPKWTVNSTNGWLFEAEAYNSVGGAEIPVPEHKIISQHDKTLTVDERTTTDADGNTVIHPGRVLNSDEMRFVIYKTTNTTTSESGAYDLFEYRYWIRVIPEDTDILIVPNLEDKDREITVYKDDGAVFKDEMTVFIEKDTYNLGDKELEIKLDGEENADDVAIYSKCIGKNDQYYPIYRSGSSFQALYSPIIYSDAKLISTVHLNSEGCDLCDDKCDPWKHTWANIVESDGGTRSFRYYIREVSVNTDYGTIENYNTTYYDSNDNQIYAELINCITYDENGNSKTEELWLYSIDTKVEGDTDGGYLKILNVPKTSLELEKQWTGVAADDITEVLVDIYTGKKQVSADGTITYVNGEHMQLVTLRDYEGVADRPADAVSWQATLSDLPRYVQNEETGEWEEIVYFVKEQDMEGFITSYNPYQSVTLTFADGSTLEVYTLATDPNNPTMQSSIITNRGFASGLFELRIEKRSDLEGNPVLPGVEFTLERLDGTVWTQVSSAKTSEYGSITFSSIDSNFELESSQTATYRIRETYTPLGYTQIKGSFQFVVSSDTNNVVDFGELTFVRDDNYSDETVPVYNATLDKNSYILTLAVVNKVEPIIIPSTGGVGIMVVIIPAATLLLIAFSAVYLRKKHGKGQI